MYCGGGGGGEELWSCGKSGTLVGSMVRDIRDPCLSQSPIKVVIPVRYFLINFYFDHLFLLYFVLSAFLYSVAIIKVKLVNREKCMCLCWKLDERLNCLG